ncbi:MAG TPA: type I-F CRISPR-associated helicase Cas3 [Selenomonas sp.]|nr:type I-F CRISPR-associated helicase Cas3 [Selenomonas sp.]
MMVIFTSRSEKKALMSTRKILDTFADRIGNDTWKTIITEDGLSTVRLLLRKHATKSTAVACHWLRSRNRSELLWVVGNRDKFNDQGIVPVHSTKKNLRHGEWENNWIHLPAIKALTAVASLLHDWGKANQAFQKMLASPLKHKDPFRHEWLSCKLISALIASTGSGDSDKIWIEKLHNFSFDEKTISKTLPNIVNETFAGLPPIASLICWLILTHHRMPGLDKNTGLKYKGNTKDSISAMLSIIESDWGYQKDISVPVKFPHGLLKTSVTWEKQLKKWTQRLLDECENILRLLETPALRPVLHYARLSMMMADYYISSKPADTNWKTDCDLYAKSGAGQKLDEHLVRVAEQALKIVHRLPQLSEHMDSAKDIRALRKKSPKPFIWQDNAVEDIRHFREAHDTDANNGWFIVNMASTGCGKTIANAKIMQAISKDAKSLRYILALGLRSLTLQTGTEYRQRIGLSEDELAVLVGDSSVRELYQQAQEDSNSEESRQEDLLDSSLHYALDNSDNFLDIFFDNNKPSSARKNQAFLYKPVLVATIDHFILASETTRGGKYMLPFLRLMSSDLVIDEVDDFNANDLIPIAHLVHLAGMLGRNVAISSATIPPDLAEGLFCSYREGRELYNGFTQQHTSLTCVLCDEFKTSVSNIPGTLDTAGQDYRKLHEEFVRKRILKLGKQTVKRKACLIPLDKTEIPEDSQLTSLYFSKIRDAAISMHNSHHFIDTISGKKISFGLIRMANINPCVCLSLFLLHTDWKGCAVRLMTYHSRQTLLLRHEQETYLDRVLKRKEADPSGNLSDPVIRTHINNTIEDNLIFLVISTPVEEIGRDHDFDWAVVEPSSYRSIIQLAGRILRHRKPKEDISSPNIAILQYNLKGLEGDSHAFSRPGYETSNRYRFTSHDMNDLVDQSELLARVDAVPRILKPSTLEPQKHLIHLEHQVMQDFRDMSVTGPETLHGYFKEYWWMTGIPQVLHPFREGDTQMQLYLCYRDGKLVFCEKSKEGDYIPTESTFQIENTPNIVEPTALKRLWLNRDYEAALHKQLSLSDCPPETEDTMLEQLSKKYGKIAFPACWSNSRYVLLYSDQFGLWKKE